MCLTLAEVGLENITHLLNLFGRHMKTACNVTAEDAGLKSLDVAAHVSLRVEEVAVVHLRMEGRI